LKSLDDSWRDFARNNALKIEIGPAPPCERWKKTPDDQRWRKETGQRKR